MEKVDVEAARGPDGVGQAGRRVQLPADRPPYAPHLRMLRRSGRQRQAWDTIGARRAREAAEEVYGWIKTRRRVQ